MSAKTLMYQDRLFTFSHEEPYRTRDDRLITLYCWVGECRTCGAPFDVKTTNPDPASSSIGKRFHLVTCPAHRLSNRESLALARKAQKEARRPKKVDPKGPRTGAIQQAVLDAITLIGDTDYSTVVDTVRGTLPPPEEGARDRRRDKVAQAVAHLVEDGRLRISRGCLSLC